MTARQSQAELKPRRIDTGHWQLELLAPAPYCVRYAVSGDEIGFAYDYQSGEHAIGTDRRTSFSVRAHALALRRQGCDIYSSSERGGEYLRLSGNEVRLGHDGGTFFDARASLVAQGLRRMLLAGAATLDLENLVLALLDMVDELDGSQTVSPTGWMTANRMRRIDEIIDARLGEDLTVAELAQELQLSTRHFCRAFRDATGRSPRDHIILSRLRQARRLIETGEPSLARIAVECGFSSHAHMTAQFRHRLGVSPAQLRARHFV